MDSEGVELVDVAPTSELQELILERTMPDPGRLGPVTAPRLGAAAVARLRAYGVHPAVLAACCADPAELDELTAEFGADPVGPIEAEIVCWLVRQHLASNPNTSEAAVWHLATVGRL